MNTRRLLSALSAISILFFCSSCDFAINKSTKHNSESDISNKITNPTGEFTVLDFGSLEKMLDIQFIKSDFETQEAFSLRKEKEVLDVVVNNKIKKVSIVQNYQKLSSANETLIYVGNSNLHFDPSKGLWRIDIGVDKINIHSEIISFHNDSAGYVDRRIGIVFLNFEDVKRAILASKFENDCFIESTASLCSLFFGKMEGAEAERRSVSLRIGVSGQLDGRIYEKNEEFESISATRKKQNVQRSIYMNVNRIYVYDDIDNSLFLDLPISP